MSLMLIAPRCAALVLIGALLHPVTPGAEDAFVNILLRAMQAHNVKQVAGLFQYPFRLGAPGVPLPIPVNSPAELIRMYDMVFNPAMRCAIETSRIPNRSEPRPPFKMAIAEGVVTLADGRVIASRTKDGMRITRMTLLMGTKAPARPPQRLNPSSRAQASGRLAHDDVDAYLVSLRAGSDLTVAVEGFPGRSLLLRVRDAATNALVQGAPTEFSRTWNARVPQAGDYRIEIVRNTGYCDPDVTYVLTAGVR